MPQILQYYLGLGLLADPLLTLFYSGDTYAVIAIGIWVVMTIIAGIAFNSTRKKGCLPAFIVVLVYTVLLGAMSLVGSFILWAIFSGIGSALTGDGSSRKPKKPKTPDQLEDDRMDALRIEQLHADELLRCMDNVEQARYIAEFQRLVYDKTVTPDEIESRLRHWEFYRRNPMLGSEEYRRTHPDE